MMEVDVELREPEHEPESGPGDGRAPEREAETEARAETPELAPPVDDVPPESAEPEGRRYPSTIGGAFYLLVVLASGVGLVIVSQGAWRVGVKWIAGSLVLAALVRLVIPTQQAGMLAVRRRSLDVVILVLAGLALWILSTSIPNQPPL
jgi:hypothetical protein